MAIYHLTVKVISRAAGSSVLASAAYRSASRLHDERLDRAHDFTRKTGVVHSEILLPDGAPEHLGGRERLWNAVEAGEKRKDAQLSREVEFAIPREMTQADGIALARDFVQREMVDRGMVADLNVHWEIGADGQARPHAHVMLTLREFGDGRAGAPDFGAKVRDWNATALVEHWREAWADHVNARLAALDIDASIDHRTLEAQGLDLEPQNKIGPAAARRAGEGLEVERLADHAEIARRNGARIIAEPSIALDAMTHQQATFTRRDVAMFVHRHSDGKEQFDQAMSAVMEAPDLVALGHYGRSAERFTSRDMIASELRLELATSRLAVQAGHPVDAHHRTAALSRSQAAGLTLSGEQRAAFDHVTASRDLGVVVGYAGTGKSALLGVAREAWESAGYTVRGAALSGIAAENLESGSGIASRTLASLELAWSQGREPLRARDVLVIDEAGLVGTRQMERVVSAAQQAGAKVVLVGDPEQLQSIEAGAAFRATVEQHPHVEITEVRRQREDWQRDATRHLATGRTADALQAYGEHAMVHAGETRAAAQAELIDRWDKDRLEHPDQTRIILSHTNEARHALNAAARERLRDAGQLGEDATVQTEAGTRVFARGDRVMLLKNDRGLGVKNGILGSVGAVTPRRMTVDLDAGRSVVFDLKDYAHVDHGYAATLHKSQGVTVDRTHVLATPGLDRHSTYVALSRHRDRVDLHYGKDDFENGPTLARRLSRERTKDMALDHRDASDPDAARLFAERRGITFPERAKAVVRKVRDIFAGFKPLDRSSPEALQHASPDRPAKTPSPARDDFGDLRRRAVQGHARAVVEVLQAGGRGHPALPHQVTALQKARTALDCFDRNASSVLEREYRADHGLVEDVAGHRTQRAIRILQREAELQADPAKRADRFVTEWGRLNARRSEAYADGDMKGMAGVRHRMAEMAQTLERDPQMESLLRNRQAALGVEAEAGRSLAQTLATSIGADRGRGRGMGI
jgi:Ti-type conjugative transfer relaxase TraA